MRQGSARGPCEVRFFDEAVCRCSAGVLQAWVTKMKILMLKDSKWINNAT